MSPADAQLVENRQIRLYRHFTANPGLHQRDRIMAATGFPCPRTHPVCAYVEFQNALMRLNANLTARGERIVKVSVPEKYHQDAEIYELQRTAKNAVPGTPP